MALGHNAACGCAECRDERRGVGVIIPHAPRPPQMPRDDPQLQLPELPLYTYSTTGIARTGIGSLLEAPAKLGGGTVVGQARLHMAGGAEYVAIVVERGDGSLWAVYYDRELRDLTASPIAHDPRDQSLGVLRDA